MLALADLQDPTPVPIEKVTYDARRGALTVWYRDGSGGGFGVDLSADRAEVIAEVADRIQELFN